MRDFRKLAVWERSHHLVLAVYAATRTFPREEMFGLTSQVRRCASSIPANIAEGCGRNSSAEMARFLDIAMGSASELEYHLLLAHDLGYLSSDEHTTLASTTTEIKRMLTAFTRKLRATPQADS